jgi:hypothetical protein
MAASSRPRPEGTAKLAPNHRTELLRAFDDDSDRTAISLGIELYALVPSHVSPRELVETILMAAGLQSEQA